MAYLGNAPARSFISFERQVFTIVNSQTAYTLSHSVNNENDLRLVINNIVQEPGSGKAYTASGTTLTLSAALTNGTDEMYCVFLGRAVGTVNPPAASVGSTQLASDAVTAAKLNDDIISGQTALGATPADTDEFLVSDAGTIKRVDYSYLKGGTNTPTFLSTMSATQTPSSATATLVNFDQTTYDTGSGYNTSSKKYVIPSAGYYHLYTCVNLYNSSNDLDRIILYLYVNAAVRFQTDSQPLNAASDFVYLGGVWNCSANDEITVQVYQVSGSGTGTIANDKSFFGGYKLIS